MASTTWGQDRPRGILSKADREFLIGERELGSPQARCNTRARIRERVRHAYFDMMLLWRYLKPEDLQKVVHPDERRNQIRLRKALQDTIALTVCAVDQANDDKPLRIACALGQAGAADQFEAREDGVGWKEGVQDSIPTEFVLEYPPGTTDKPLSYTDDDQIEDPNDDMGIGYPNRIEWDEKLAPSPSELDEPHTDEGTALEALIDSAYNEYGYLTHERLIQDRSVSPETIAEAYNEVSLGEVSARQVRRERRAWDKMGLERPIFIYPLYRKKSDGSETLFDEFVVAPWWNDRSIGAKSDYFEEDSE